eukprot:TRINITY_DN13027_c0_g1_i1.p1 TRINITY_DN13027_c0_g1~~TRINITY_DN13027_c0_g1_i1.p1  ORF type:complete len:283 (+),score=28.76 TRINITY_DN13027_c0_g1_i1:125-973(+)
MGASVSRSVGLAALADVAVQFACFVLAAALKTEVFYDVSASLTYILCVLLTWRRGSRDLRQRVNSGLVVVWAARLGSFLLWRVLHTKHDARFDGVRTNPKRFFIFWAIQALWIFVTALPVYVLNGKGAARIDTSKTRNKALEHQTDSKPTSPPIGWRDRLGWALWVLGFALQVTADMQKTSFHADPANHGHWTNVGLWSMARHPNYFGEMCMWWGIFASCSTALQGVELSTAVSPAFVSYLLLRVSGVPMLRRSGLKKWGHLPDYQQYLQTTRLLVPLPTFA